MYLLWLQLMLAKQKVGLTQVLHSTVLAYSLVQVQIGKQPHNSDSGVEMQPGLRSGLLR